jgi:hypothetical protein
MGIFAFANPDKPAWIGHDADSSKLSLYPTEEAAKSANAVEIEDIH